MARQRGGSESIGMERQLQIYMDGMQGAPPEQPIAPAALREKAREVLSPEAFGYLDGGAGIEDTMRANRKAFRRWRLLPRMLRGPETRDLRVELFGQTFRAPFLLAPIGVLSIVHEAAEVGAAEAARALDLPFILSTASSRSIEEVAEALGETPRWFQLYWGKDPELTESLIRRAEDAGYSALVVTLDTTMLSWRPRDLQQGYLPFLYGEGLANYFTDPVFRNALDEPPEENLTQAVLYFASIFSNPGLSWDDLAFLRERTDLPILLKGILAPDDARRALDHGMDGVIVSNHGGRQVDGALAALEALPPIAKAVGEELAVLFDSGIRTGSDVLKALALGAEAVLVGRPYAYGLTVDGPEGARRVLHDFLADLDLTLGLCGCSSVSELGPEYLVDRS